MTASLGIRVVRSSLVDWWSMKKECRHARHNGVLWKNPRNRHATCSIQTALLIFFPFYNTDISNIGETFSKSPNVAGPRIYNTAVWINLAGYCLCKQFSKKKVMETGFAEDFFGLSRDGVYSDLFENLSVYSLKRDLSNNTAFNSPLLSLVSTFNVTPDSFLCRWK